MKPADLSDLPRSSWPVSATSNLLLVVVTNTLVMWISS
jgi:hypothetical protein